MGKVCLCLPPNRVEKHNLELLLENSVIVCILPETVMNGDLGTMQKFIQVFQKGLFFLKLPRSQTLFQCTVSANSEASDTLLVSL